MSGSSGHKRDREYEDRDYQELNLPDSVSPAGGNDPRFDRPFAMPSTPGLNRINELPQWKKEEIWGKNWTEPTNDPTKVHHWKKTPPGANDWTHYNHEGW